MARGATQQQALMNQQAGTQFQNSQNLYGSINAADQGIIANPGFSKEQVNTQMNAAMTPIAGQTAAAEGRLVNRAARTRNSAGLVAGEDELARERAQLSSQAAYGVQSEADKVALQERDAALNRQSGLYGPTVSSANSLYGNATEAMKARKSWVENLQGVGDFVGNLGRAATGTANLYGAING